MVSETSTLARKTVKETSEKWWRYIRRAELNAAMKYFPGDKEVKILEIGGMDGYHARRIADMGYRNISSVDICPLSPQYFPVQQTTGSELGFTSQAFEVIYSSHVVAHIQDLDTSFREMKRVSAENASFIHIVPTTTWTLITNCYHYLFLVASVPSRVYRLLNSSRRSPRSPSGGGFVVGEGANERLTKRQKLKYMLLNPLGENPSFLHELYLFSPLGWRRLFSKHGFRIVSSASSPHLYSGYGVFPARFLRTRRFLAWLGFSGSRCLVLKKDTRIR